MSKKARIELVPAGISALLRSSEMADACKEAADGVAARAGDGYSANVMIGPHRAVARVVADTPRAYYSNLKHNTLLKALGGGTK